MDIQRVVLLIALALISYIMVLQWNQDYNQPTSVATVSQPSVPLTQPGSDLPASTIPSASDLPAPAAQTDTAITVPSTANAATSSQFIQVTTDILDLFIDPRGGDIVQASLLEHRAQIDRPDPFVLLEQNMGRTYIAQSGLVGRDGPDANSEGRPLYQSAQSQFTMQPGQPLSVDLRYTTADQVDIIKRFTFEPDSYRIAVSYIIDNNSSNAFQTAPFGQIKRDGTADPTSSSSIGMASYLGGVFSTESKKYLKYDFKDMEKENFRETSQDGWVAFSQHYFLSAWIPQPGQTHVFQSRKVNNDFIVGFISPVTEVAPGQQAELTQHLFLGPKKQEQLSQTAPNLELTVDFGWLWWVAFPLYHLLTFIYSFLGNWGLAIIGITIIVKAILYPLNAKAFRSMAKMRKFGPEMVRMKELYGDDRQKMSQEMMKLYQKEKINPLGGCLPIVAQMPVFIALYWVLMESVELRHAPFFLYIKDLSVMDPYFILPIVMGVTMFFQQKLNPTPPDPMQAKIMKWLPVVFTFFFLWFPAGLVLYWVVNNILSISQQWYITRQIENEDKKSAT